MSTLLLVLASALPTANDRPDIVFVLSDDHRSDFLSCAGHPVVQTPFIDQLAKRGTRFPNAFVTTSICAASRATILTGRYEHTHGFTFKTPPLKRTLALDSYPAHLKRAGYRTGFVGKFGVGLEGGKAKKGGDKGNFGMKSSPGTMGEMFDVAHVLGRNPYIKKQADGTLRHVSDIAGDRCLEFIESTPDDQSLCLSLSFNAAHAEDSDKENHYSYPFAEAGLYEGADVPEPLVDREFWKTLPEFFHNSMHRDRYFWRWDTPEKYRHNYINYCRLLTGLDRNIGRVLEALEIDGRLDNAVVIFMGDNGYYAGSRGFAGKWSHYEESLRVPMVVCDFRGGQPENQLRFEDCLNLDIAATIMDYAGLDRPRGYQGASLRPFVEGAEVLDWRSDFFIEHRMDHDPIPKYEGVRAGQYKYARYYEKMTPEAGGPGEFLHDLEADPTELVNLADDPKSADLLAEMRKRTEELSESTQPR